MAHCNLIARHSVIMTKTEMNTVQFMISGVGCMERLKGLVNGNFRMEIYIRL